MKSKPAGEKKKKDKDKEKNPEKIRSTQVAANLKPREPGGLGRASPRPRDLGCVSPKLCDPGRTT